MEIRGWSDGISYATKNHTITHNSVTAPATSHITSPSVTRFYPGRCHFAQGSNTFLRGRKLPATRYDIGRKNELVLRLGFAVFVGNATPTIHYFYITSSRWQFFILPTILSSLRQFRHCQRASPVSLKIFTAHDVADDNQQTAS